MSATDLQPIRQQNPEPYTRSPEPAEGAAKSAETAERPQADASFARSTPETRDLTGWRKHWAIALPVGIAGMVVAIVLGASPTRAGAVGAIITLVILALRSYWSSH